MSITGLIGQDRDTQTVEHTIGHEFVSDAGESIVYWRNQNEKTRIRC